MNEWMNDWKIYASAEVRREEAVTLYGAVFGSFLACLGMVYSLYNADIDSVWSRC